MYSIATLKAVAAVVSLGLGAGAVAITVGIQHDPMLFTSGTQRIDVPYAPRAAPIGLPPVAVIVEPEPVPAATVATDELKAETAKTVERVTAPMQTGARVATPTRATPTKNAITPDESMEDRVIPAPCNHGEYRKLDENQGVRLLCPGQF
ncbi:MAG: hypothetical protein IPI67_33750 [Myxococcales bacterium]|nr:hypothetical protein [Myxococcales bacterium]